MPGVLTGWTIWMDILEPDGTWAWHKGTAPGQVPTQTIGHGQAIRDSVYQGEVEDDG